MPASGRMIHQPQKTGQPTGCGLLTDGEPWFPGALGVPGFRLVIGMDGDRRGWVRVANALLEGIVSGAVRAGSRVPPVTSLGLKHPLAPGTTVRAFRVLASEGVLDWVPGLGYHVRASITVAVSTGPRRDGGLTAVLPGSGVGGW